MKAAILLTGAILASLLIKNSCNIRSLAPTFSSPSIVEIGYGWPMVCFSGVAQDEGGGIRLAATRYWQKTYQLKPAPIGLLANISLAAVICFSTYTFIRWLSAHISFRLTLLSIFGFTGFSSLWIAKAISAPRVTDDFSSGLLPIYCEILIIEVCDFVVWSGIFLSCVFLRYWLRPGKARSGGIVTGGEQPPCDES